ncbi:hypothetical protein [Oxobacter pfennigii]|uniref:hypothetical protein n=1 Tax=Oxobacter pfennigii TaxID=36849 RepID=UPI001364C37E|nr:hypothetical protein [Oxobacter pfennigii]
MKDLLTSFDGKAPIQPRGRMVIEGQIKYLKYTEVYGRGTLEKIWIDNYGGAI